MWQSQSPKPVRCGPVYPPEPPPAHKSLSDYSQPPRPQTVSLHQVIEAHDQQSYFLTSENTICCEMSCKSKKKLTRRAEHWEVVGTDSDEESDSFESDHGDEDDNDLFPQVFNLSSELYRGLKLQKLQEKLD